MSSSRTALAVLAVLVLPSALGACSGSDDGAASPSSSSASPSSSLTWRDYEPGGPAGEVEEILGWSGTMPTAQQYIDQQRITEVAVAACMADQGFDYVPQVPRLSDVVVMPEDPPRSSPEFVARWGYGVLNMPDENAGGGMQISMPEGAGWMDGFDTMSEAEQEAFLTALWGPVTEETADGGTMREGGCVESIEPGAGDEHLTAVREEAQAFLEALSGSSSFDALNREWADCLREAGFTDASPQLAYQRFSLALDELIANAGDEDPWSSEEAKALGAEEIEVATADLACRTQTDYVARYNAIDLQAQADYVAANRADLDALAASIG